ncbi:MAG TPA: GGDEF domain-containing protein [Terriglobales bacterium]|nr:GGDEF domain-containing protein [Terriglobales bacterium]
MDKQIRTYADALYEAALMDLSNLLRDARLNAFQKIAAEDSGRIVSGVGIQTVIKLFIAHIERCMTSRLESYQQAHGDSDILPTGQDFTDILTECKEVQVLQIKHSTKALERFISSRVPIAVTIGSIESQLKHGSDHGYDAVLRKWKIWKAKSQLKPPTKIEHREKRRDVLLPIYNRSEFDADLTKLVSGGSCSSPLALVFMDLDKFKSINDGPGGHEAGDRALKALSEAVLRACENKGITYRFGGDELCVLLPNHSLDESSAVGERIRSEVCAIRTDEIAHGLSTSIGVACFPESTEDQTKLLSFADAAMYESKRAGGHRVSKSNGLNE